MRRPCARRPLDNLAAAAYFTAVISAPEDKDQKLGAAQAFRSWPGRRLLLSAALFLIVPLLFVITVSQLTRAKGPQWLPYSFENPYNYLFSSLLLVKGQAPKYIDHPGITTQVFGAFILRISSVKSTDDLIWSVLRNPEKNIRKLHWALLIFTALILWMAPWATAVVLRNNIVGLLIQAPCLFYQSLLYYGILFGSDLMLVPFSIAAVCCCTLLAVPSARSNKLEILFGIGSASQEDSARLVQVPFLATLTGLVCAFGIVTKLTFFPLILISLLCCRAKRNLLSFIGAFVLGLVIALLPIQSELSRFWTWTFNLGIHREHYGGGAVGFPPVSIYLSSLSMFLQNEKLLAIIPTVALIATILLWIFPSAQKSLSGSRPSVSGEKNISLFRYFKTPVLQDPGFPHGSEVPRTISRQTVLGLFVIQLISFLAIAKHPGVHYLIPLFLTTGFTLVLLLYAFQSSDSAVNRAIGSLVLIGLLFLGFKHFIALTPATYASLHQQSADQLRLYKHAREITKNDVRVDCFFGDSPEFALWYGNYFSGRTFGPLLARMYPNPNARFFNVFNPLRFETFTEDLDLEAELKKYDHLYFLGLRQENFRSCFPKSDGLDPMTFETIDHAGDFYLQKWTRK